MINKLYKNIAGTFLAATISGMTTPANATNDGEYKCVSDRNNNWYIRICIPQDNIKTKIDYKYNENSGNCTILETIPKTDSAYCSASQIYIVDATDSMANPYHS